ncbi:hypothetical protein IPG41_05585 [Candidatus Peregrinibacteria bacterium]|nr:MAG: hypothetical protein IPG41_05585 [Candidatus Peregrinibacteria bacterium]
MQVPMPEGSAPFDADLFDVLRGAKMRIRGFGEEDEVLLGSLRNEGFDQIECVTAFACCVFTGFTNVDADAFVCHGGLFFDRLKLIFPVIMSLSQRMKQGFLRLPLRKQVVLLASAGLMISPLMPWYDERNSFGVGESYLGVQGPFFLIGFMVMGLGAIGFFNMFLPLLGKNFFNLKKKGGIASVLLGFQAALLMVVATSIFFHPDFGVNLSTKSTRFGMTFAFFMTGFMMIAGWFARRKDSDVEEEVSVEEPVEEVEIQEDRPFAGPSYTQERVSQAVNTPASPVDPLILDPTTRYRLMQSRMRQAGGASMHYGNNSNFWGGRHSANPYGGTPSSDQENN